MKKYDEKQREAMRIVFGLTNEQVGIVEEAETWAEDNLPPNPRDPNDPLTIRYSMQMMEYLKEKNLWDEVGEALSKMQRHPREYMLRYHSMGMCLVAAMGLLEAN